jgi:hypothetical protein
MAKVRIIFELPTYIKVTKHRHDRERNDFQGKERVLLLVYKYDTCFHVQRQVLFMDLTRLGLLFKRWLIKKFQECIYGEIIRRRPN